MITDAVGWLLGKHASAAAASCPSLRAKRVTPHVLRHTAAMQLLRGVISTPYAHDLRDYFAFLALRGVDCTSVRLEDVGAFVAWLRLPPPARDGHVVALPSATPYCSAATINRKLSALATLL